MIASHRYFLHFPKCETDVPIVYHLVRDFNLVINIFRAKVTAEGEGFLVLDIKGEEDAIEKGKEYIAGFGVNINSVNKGIERKEDRCTNCGNCLAHCPTKAMHISDPATRKVEFNETLCIACGKCVSNCPMGACSSIF